MGRVQRTVTGDVISTTAHINDVKATLKYTKMIMFADDMAFYCHEKLANKLQIKLNVDFKIMTCLCHNKLTLNFKKSKLVVIGSAKKLKDLCNIQLTSENDELEYTSSFKYLGVIANEHLTWHDHIDYVESKIAP